MLREESILDLKIMQGTVLEHPRLLDTRVEERLSTLALKRHLRVHRSYVPGLHQMHETIVRESELTPAKVLQYKLTRCPSVVCSEGAREFTPEQLVDHFKQLGIEPFWTRHENTGPVSMNLYSMEGNTTARVPFAFAEDMVCSMCGVQKSDYICAGCRRTKGCWACLSKVERINYYYMGTIRCPNCATRYIVNSEWGIQYLPF